MKVAVKKVDTLRRELKFEIPKDRVSKRLDEVFADISKVAKIKGFRPGKAPRNLVESEHGALAREETVKSLIPEIYKEGLEQEKLSPIDMPEIEDVEFKDGVITFTAKLEIRPEITVKNYKGITVKRKSSQVTDEELGKTLEYFTKSLGKDKEVALDDQFAKGLGYPTLEDFKKSLVRQMEFDKDRQNRMDVENQIVEALIKDTKVVVPQSLLKRQIEHRVGEVVQRMKSQGMPETEIAKREEELRKDLVNPVERDIKAYLVFDKIAQEEKITVGEGESVPQKVMAFLMAEAKWEDSK